MSIWAVVLAIKTFALLVLILTIYLIIFVRNAMISLLPVILALTHIIAAIVKKATL